MTETSSVIIVGGVVGGVSAAVNKSVKNQVGYGQKIVIIFVNRLVLYCTVLVLGAKDSVYSSAHGLTWFLT